MRTPYKPEEEIPDHNWRSVRESEATPSGEVITLSCGHQIILRRARAFHCAECEMAALAALAKAAANNGH